MGRHRADFFPRRNNAGRQRPWHHTEPLGHRHLGPATICSRAAPPRPTTPISRRTVGSWRRRAAMGQSGSGMSRRARPSGPSRGTGRHNRSRIRARRPPARIRRRRPRWPRSGMRRPARELASYSGHVQPRAMTSGVLTRRPHDRFGRRRLIAGQTPPRSSSGIR